MLYDGVLYARAPSFDFISTYLGLAPHKKLIAGLPILRTHTKNQFANKPEGLRHFRDHRWKALGEENPILSGLFLFRHHFESYTE